jgi:hypothetical protein
MNRNDRTDELWAAAMAADRGPDRWYADAESLRYSLFDKVEDDA